MTLVKSCSGAVTIWTDQCCECQHSCQYFMICNIYPKIQYDIQTNYYISSVVDTYLL